MSIRLEDYFAPATFAKIKQFADQQETPFVILDLATIERAYDELAEHFPYAKIYFAVKANPAAEITELLNRYKEAITWLSLSGKNLCLIRCWHWFQSSPWR